MDDFDLAFGPVTSVKRYNGRRIEVRGWSENDLSYHERNSGFTRSYAAMCAKIDKDTAQQKFEEERRLAARCAEKTAEQNKADREFNLEIGACLGAVGGVLTGPGVIAGVIVGAVVSGLFSK